MRFLVIAFFIAFLGGAMFAKIIPQNEIENANLVITSTEEDIRVHEDYLKDNQGITISEENKEDQKEINNIVLDDKKEKVLQVKEDSFSEKNINANNSKGEFGTSSNKIVTDNNESYISNKENIHDKKDDNDEEDDDEKDEYNKKYIEDDEEDEE